MSLAAKDENIMPEAGQVMKKGWHFTDVKVDPLFTRKAGFVLEKNCWRVTEVQWNLTEFAGRLESREDAVTPVSKSNGLMLRCSFEGTHKKLRKKIKINKKNKNDKKLIEKNEIG